MKKFLWVSNIIMFMMLMFLIVYYQIPQKVAYRLFVPDERKLSTSEIDCSYKLYSFDFHNKMECDTPAIVMLGNSIVREGKWTTLLNRNDVINRGISGDVLSCMCSRLKYLKDKKAKIWFIEGGINDLPEGEVADLFEHYKYIVDFVKRENAIPVINLVFHVSPDYGSPDLGRPDYRVVNKKVKELNALLIEYAEENKIDYIDLNKIISENDILKKEYTYDGLHLTEKAYKEWAILIKEILLKNRIN